MSRPSLSIACAVLSIGQLFVTSPAAAGPRYAMLASSASPDQACDLLRPLSEIEIPDEGLAACVEATGAEFVYQLTSLACTARGIQSTEGVQSLCALESLDLSANELEGTVDVSTLVDLVSLRVQGNSALTGLNLAGTNQLEELFAYSCGLTGIIWPDDPSHLATVNASSNPAIGDVTPLSSATALESLSLSSCGATGQLQFLDQPNLISLQAQGNPGLVALDLRGANHLELIHAYSCGLTSIRWPDNPSHLAIVNASSNPGIGDVTPLSSATALESLSLSSCGASGQLHFVDQPGLISVQVQGNPGLVSLDLRGANHLELLHAYSCGLTSLRWPDDPSRLAIVNASYNPGVGDVTALSSATSLESLSLSSCGATGRLSFLDQPGLNSVQVQGNIGLTVLDVRGANQLELLYAYSCGLTNLRWPDDPSQLAIINASYNPSIGDVTALSSATSLESLSLASSGATGKLLFANQPNLISLQAHGNPGLTALDLSGANRLELLHAYSCGLTSILWPDDPSRLAIVNAGANPGIGEITALSSATALESLSLTSCDATGQLYFLNQPALVSLQVQGNPRLTALDLSGANQLQVLQASSSGLTGVRWPEEPELLSTVDVAYNPSIGHVAALSGATGLESLNLISSGASGVLDLTRQEHLSSLRLEGNPTLKLVVLPEQCGELSFLSYDPDANVVRGRLCTAVIDLHNPD